MADIFKAVLDISLAASALALLAMAARLIIGRRPNAALPLLSALIILRLSIPAAIPSPLSVMNLFQNIGAKQPVTEEVYNVNETAGYEFTQPIVNTGTYTAENTAAENDIQIGEIDPDKNVTESNAAEDRPAAKPLSAMEIASIIWIAGMAAIAACVAASNIRFTLTLKKNRRYDAPGFGELLEQCKEELSIRRRIEAVQLSGINTAAVYGVLRPKLLISPSLSWLTDEEKKHVLLHELSHIKRLDTLVCLLITALSAVYWFNPVLWIALALARRDMEIMCDMAVLKLTQDKRSYASTLFSLAKAAGNSKPKLVSALFIGPQNALRFGVLVSTDSIKRRMKMITRYKKSRLFTAVSLMLVFAIAIAGCTGAVVPAADDTEGFLPALTDQVLVSRFVIDYTAFSNDAAHVANIERAAALLDGTVFPHQDAGKEDMDILIDLTAKFSAAENIEWKAAPFLGWEAVQQLGPNDITGGENYKQYTIPADRIPDNASLQVGGGKELVLAAVYNAGRYAYMNETVSYSIENDISSGWLFISNLYNENVTIKVRTENNMIVAEIYVPEGAEKAVLPGFMPPEVEGQKFIASYSLDFSSIADDEARVANIKKAAKMLDGTVFPHMDDSLPSGEDFGRQIDIPDALRPITEEAGWRNAAWTGWGGIDVCIHENDNTSGYFAATQNTATETIMQVGGGIEITAMAYYRAATNAGLDSGSGYAVPPEEDNVDAGGLGAMNNNYVSDLVLRMWVQDNCVIAAFYAKGMAEKADIRGFNLLLPKIEGMKPVASYYLDYSSIADDEARVSNIEKAAEAVSEAAKTAVYSVSDSMEGYTVNYKIGPITEERGWRSAPWADRETFDSAGDWTYQAPGTGGATVVYDIGLDSGADSDMRVGGGIDAVFYAVTKAAALAGGEVMEYPVSPDENNMACCSIYIANLSALTLKVWTVNDMIIAAFYESEYTSDSEGRSDDEDNWRIKYADKFTTGAVEQTDNTYKDANINVSIQKVQKDNATYFIADIYVADPEYFRTAIPANAGGTGGREYTDVIAKEKNAIIAINGDIFLDDTGTVVRNGQIYRLPKSSADVLVMYSDGNMRTFSPDGFDTTSLKEQGVYQAWTMGPMLLKDGKPMTEFNVQQVISGRNPRTAVGCYEPGHYCFVVVDGRQPGYSDGLTLTQLSQLFADLGCTEAYNLEGGYSSEMVFMNKTVNNPGQNARRVTDILYIGE